MKKINDIKTKISNKKNRNVKMSEDMTDILVSLETVYSAMNVVKSIEDTDDEDDLKFKDGWFDAAINEVEECIKNVIEFKKNYIY